MAVFSTFRSDRAPQLDDPEIQYLAPPDKNRHGFFAWQIATTPVWGLAGMWLRDATVPEWLMQEKLLFPFAWLGFMGFVVFPCLFSFTQRFVEHYVAIRTVDLPKADRILERYEFDRKSVVACFATSFFFFPALIGSLFCLFNFMFTYDCFLQWFTYGRGGVDAPGVLRSPARQHRPGRT